jgi:hypothetical protein
VCIQKPVHVFCRTLIFSSAVVGIPLLEMVPGDIWRAAWPWFTNSGISGYGGFFFGYRRVDGGV